MEASSPKLRMDFCWVAGTQTLEPSPAASQGVRQQEAASEASLNLYPGGMIQSKGILSNVLVATPNACSVVIFKII